METRVEAQIGEEPRESGESRVGGNNEVGRWGEWERERRECLSPPTCLFPSAYPLHGPSDPAYQITWWRGWWCLGAKFSNWPAFWEFLWEAPVCSQGHGSCVSLLGGRFSAQSWLIVHPPCPLTDENHTRLFHVDTRGPWRCLVTLGALTARGWGPGNSQSFIINFWTVTLVVVVVVGEERLKDNLEMLHKEYMLFLDKFRKFRYTQKRKPRKWSVIT